MAYFLGRDVSVKIKAGDDVGANTDGTVDVDGSTPLFASTAGTTVTDLTGVDLGIGVTDEDITYMGSRTVLKAEIKKETTITLTRKKKDNVWNVCFNEARFGINEDGDGLADGRQQPDYTGYGFRVYLKFATGTSGETFVLPNCCITDYTTSMSPDATQEESITLMSYVDPIILDGADTTEQVADAAGGL